MALNHIEVLHFNKAEQIFKLLGLLGLFERYIKAKRLHSGIKLRLMCYLMIVSSVTLSAFL